MLKKPYLWLVPYLLAGALPVAQAATDCAAVTDIPSTECEALVALYKSTDGTNWRRNHGWNTNTPCKWYGVRCSDGHVTALSLYQNQLSGKIPTELGNLSHLTVLDLSSNQLSGSIPTELGNLSRLKGLSLHSNQLSGPIPTELGNLSHLRSLLLYKNQLCGKIPSELRNFKRIQIHKNHLINDETAYDPNLIAWLDQMSHTWHHQISPTDCIPMLEHKINEKQGTFEGSRCLAIKEGAGWQPATIRRVNEDGSFNIEFDIKDDIIEEIRRHGWSGMTKAEISFNDTDKWASVFDILIANKVGLGQKEFKNALALLGISVGDEQIQKLWIQSCKRLFDIEAEKAEALILDAEQAYELFRHLGLSAKTFEKSLKANTKPENYFKLYWNMVRMGGREPSEIGRPVTLDDAFAALGVSESEVNAENVSFFRAFEESHGILLPETLKKFLSQVGVASAVTDSHPNSPTLLPLEDWVLQRLDDGRGGKAYLITIMIPHQGNHEWAVVFYENDNDARVYVGLDEWKLTAPTIGMFFWDLAQTGLTWYQDTKFEGGKNVKKTDIGLRLIPMDCSLVLAAESEKVSSKKSVKEAYQKGEEAYKNRDYTTAFSLYCKAAKQGLADAQFNLGYMYARGDGVIKSYEKAVKWYRKAALQEHAVAQNNLGLMYDEGQGVPQSYQEAVKWYHKAAEQGYVTAQNNLGIMYANGLGVTKSYKEAMKWYRKAAEQGYAMAQNNLGLMYYKGQAVPQSYQEAEKWFRKAAEQGDANAQYNLEVLDDKKAKE